MLTGNFRLGVSFFCCRWTCKPCCLLQILPSVWHCLCYSYCNVRVPLSYLCPDQCGCLQLVSALHTSDMMFHIEIQLEVLQGRLTTHQVHCSVEDNKRVSFRLDYSILLCTLIFIPLKPRYRGLCHIPIEIKMIFERFCLCAHDVQTLVIQGHFSDQRTSRLYVACFSHTPYLASGTLSQNGG